MVEWMRLKTGNGEEAPRSELRSRLEPPGDISRVGEGLKGTCGPYCSDKQFPLAEEMLG